MKVENLVVRKWLLWFIAVRKVSWQEWIFKELIYKTMGLTLQPQLKEPGSRKKGWVWGKLLMAFAPCDEGKPSLHPQGVRWPWEVNLSSALWSEELPWWLRGKEPAWQCRRCGLYRWVRIFPGRKKWEPTPVFLPGKSHGQRRLVGCGPWGCIRAGHYLSTKQQQNALKGSILSPWSSAGRASCWPGQCPGASFWELQRAEKPGSFLICHQVHVTQEEW